MSFLDGKGTPENLDNIAQPIGIAMFALADGVYRYACESPKMASLLRISSSSPQAFEMENSLLHGV